MTDTTGATPMEADVDEVHGSQAEGDDPAHEPDTVVLAETGRPSQAEGEDPAHPDTVEVLDPVEPAEPA